MNNINPKNFQMSITRELKVVQDRVRNLIGSSTHRGEEGRYKEAILRSVIRRFLPNNIGLGTGFVVKKDKNDDIKVSRQIDILIYDNTYPTLFSEGDFIITTPENVKGIIEVKTKLDSREIDGAVEKAARNGQIIGKYIFNGIFVYDKRNILIEENNVDNRLKKALKMALKYNWTVNHLCFGKDIFIKFWSNNCRNDHLTGCYKIYKIDELSFSYFISNLIDSIFKTRGRRWFSYPIDKEWNIIKEIS